MNGITIAIWQLVTLLGPIIFCIFALQLIESQTQKRMTKHFGWRSNLFTGWIGAPVHEYSHAAVAHLFGLKVQKIVPFRPDPSTGRLGYVEISYDRTSTWQSIGQFFVCYAPLAGGTLALYLLTFLFYPDALEGKFEVSPDKLFGSSLDQATNQVGAIVTIENLASIRFWIFSYLVLSVGCHLAPSSVDYRASARGHGKMLVVGGIALAVFLLIGGLPDFLYSASAPVFLVLQASFLFAVLLCAVMLMIVYVVTELITWLS